MNLCKHIALLLIFSLNIIAYGNLYSIENNASISIEHKLAVPGDTVLIAVTATGFQNISAFDCRIVFNENVLDTLSIQNTVVNLHPGLSSAIYNVLNGNEVSLAWFSLSPLSIPDNEKLFDLQLIFCNELYSCAINGTSSPLDFIENHTAFVSGDEEIPLEYNHGSVSAYLPLKALNVNQVGEGLVMINENVYEEPIAVNQNTVLTLQAIPKIHWAFDEWSGDILGIENPVSLIMNDHKDVDVFFVEDTIPHDYSLSLTIVGQGTVETDGEPYAPLLVFDEDTTVSLEAFSDIGWSFVGWAGDLNGIENPQVLLVDGNKSVIAIFEDLLIEEYTLIVNTVGEGTVEINGELYTVPLIFEEGTIVNLLAVPEPAWFFDSWSGDLENIENPITITMAEDKNITANFDLKSFTITFEITDSSFIPIENAIVSLDDFPNPPGDYIFDGIEPGYYNYSVTAENYLTKTGSVEVIDEDIVLSIMLEIDPSVSIHSVNKTEFDRDKSFFRVYPNPVKDYFSLVFHGFSNVSVFTVEVYNIFGEKILGDQVSTDQTLSFSLESHPSGIYFIKAINQNNAGVQYIIKID